MLVFNGMYMEIIKSIQNINFLLEKYKTLAIANGENYNIFRVIGLTTNEKRVHSAFISNLLDPKESHGYGTVFLKLFLEQLEVEGFDVNTALLKVERNIGKKTENEGGYLDICIWDKNDFHIIIENKIYAADQENQMVRYFNYAKKRNNYHLYYLTLNGSEPDICYSCSDSLTGKVLKAEEDYSLISYSYDIKQWLELCREKATGSPLLREGISHYLNLINHLTNQNMNASLKKEIENELIKKENVLNLSMLKQAVIDAEASLQLEFWNKLKMKFKDNNFQTFESNLEAAISKYYSTTRDNKYYGLEVLIANYDGYQIRYGIRIDGYIYSGFTIWEQENNIVNQKEEYVKYRAAIEDVNSDYQSNEYWLGWKWVTPSLNFKNINKDTCKYLAEMDETIEIIYQDIISDINVFLDKIYIDSSR